MFDQRNKIYEMTQFLSTLSTVMIGISATYCLFKLMDFITLQDRLSKYKEVQKNVGYEKYKQIYVTCNAFGLILGVATVTVSVSIK